MVRTLAATGAVLISLAVGACSGSNTSSQATSPTGVASTNADTVFADQYQSLIAPCNTSEGALNDINSNTSKRKATAIGQHVADVCRGALSEMLHSHWPANVRPDIQALVTASAPLIADLQNIEKYHARVSADGAKVQSAADKVRTDLGLPAVG